MQRMATSFADAVRDLGAEGVSYRDMGYLLSGDYDPKDLTTREQVITLQQQILAQARDWGRKVMIRSGNVYAVSYADVIADMDIFGTAYSILDEDIPFYQIALHGYVDYTSEPLDMAGDPEEVLLRSAEYGAGLSYTFMAESADILVDTNYTEYTGIAWDAWGEEAMETLLA